MLLSFGLQGRENREEMLPLEEGEIYDKSKEEIEAETDLLEGQKGWQRPPTCLTGRSLVNVSQTSGVEMLASCGQARIERDVDPRLRLPHQSANPTRFPPNSHTCTVLSHDSAIPVHKPSRVPTLSLSTLNVTGMFVPLPTAQNR
jgi:hypothetical protein